ncbi:DUF4330 family protein [Anaerotignum sp. MB30-C6]|uniref:DUF4330 family protein n=1 Tax=Anaerotignum sp. MB30-C6 TaxID=3070814 RepID=UPI0027DD66EA|nr:DUF4330 family protein [Anaerotignum sp. MB30-C6]WMI81529.1 DUF4330 family protein [Anaerotignum sp. MB30-C6]
MAKRRPNVVDILILLTLVAVVVLAIVKVGVVNRVESSGVDEAAIKTTYTAFVDKVRMATVEALHEGDLIFDEKTGICIGEIKTVAYEPLFHNLPDGAGGMVQAQYPDYYRVTMTIEGSVIEKEDGYFVDGVVELKVNSETNAFTKYAKPVIKVTNIEM